MKKSNNIEKRLVDVNIGDIVYVVPWAAVYDSTTDSFHVYAGSTGHYYDAPSGTVELKLWRAEAGFVALNVDVLVDSIGIHPYSGLGDPELTRQLLPLDISAGQREYLMPTIERQIESYEDHRRKRGYYK